MKASMIRSLVVASALFVFGFFAIAPSQAQSSGSSGGCCGGSSTPNANTNTNTSTVPATCGAGTNSVNGVCMPTNSTQAN